LDRFPVAGLIFQIHRDGFCHNLPAVGRTKLRVQLAPFGGEQIPVGLDFIHELIRQTGQDVVQLAEFFRRGVSEDFAEGSQTPGGVQEIMKEQLLEDLATLFIADVLDRQKEEWFLINLKRTHPDSEIPCRAILKHHPAFLDRGFPLQSTGDCQEGTANPARFRVAASPRSFPAVDAPRNLTGSPAPQMGGTPDVKIIHRRLIRINDLTRRIDRQKDIGNGIKEPPDF